ncbi:hypothetical protein [Nocardia sp. NPDC051750]|uniref:hypothetical protein n=1 Tax=Nocardia sp. NPDC051750 TaxID=3364325 RepID=UPI0037A30DB8
MVNWHGLRPDGSLADGSDDSDHWIWSEGCPVDISALDGGRRIILLDDAPYPMQHTAARRYPGMRAELGAFETLSVAEVRAWLTRIADALPGRVPN